MDRNEPLLVAASLFWSDALNAFLFGHGPMTPTLADVFMLTGLNISETDRISALSAPTHKFDTRSIGGWKGYINLYSKTSGSVTPKEHTAFLNMWLDHYIFCGKSVGPTTQYQMLAEHLAGGNNFAIGKHLLGLVYRLLHEVSVRLRHNRQIGNLGGPWWFINLWLNNHLQNVMGINIFDRNFPIEPSDDETDLATRRCASFGEAASTFPGGRLPGNVADFFRSFYDGLKESSMSWYPYDDTDSPFELPYKFRFEDANSDETSQKIFKEILIPSVLPANLFGPKTQQSFEYYHPDVAARQLGFGQAPIKIWLADLVKVRDPLTSALSHDRLKQLSPPSDSVNTSSWKFFSFELVSFKAWWSEWRNHLFCESSKSYCLLLDPDYDDEEQVRKTDDLPLLTTNLNFNFR